MFAAFVNAITNRLCSYNDDAVDSSIVRSKNVHQLFLMLPVKIVGGWRCRVGGDQVGRERKVEVFESAGACQAVLGILLGKYKE